eukprot:g2091.t1
MLVRGRDAGWEGAPPTWYAKQASIISSSSTETLCRPRRVAKGARARTETDADCKPERRVGTTTMRRARWSAFSRASVRPMPGKPPEKFEDPVVYQCPNCGKWNDGINKACSRCEKVTHKFWN